MEMWLNYDKNSPLLLPLQRFQPSRAAGLVAVDEPSGAGSRRWSRWGSGADGVRLGGLDEPDGVTVR
jgi:hypothetical protein